MNSQPEPLNESSARRFRKIFRILGLLLVIAALLWLRPYGENYAWLGKALLLASAIAWNFVPIPPQGARSFRLMPEWRTPRYWLIMGVTSVLMVIGLKLTLSVDHFWWQYLHFLAGWVGLLYGAKLMLGRTQRISRATCNQQPETRNQ